MDYRFNVPRILLFLLAALLLLVAISFHAPWQAAAAGNWWHNSWDYRVPVTMAAGGTARTNKAAEVEINFTTLLNQLNKSGSLIVNSIRVLEVNQNGVVIDDNVPFQFDPAANFHAANNARGTLVFLLQGQTAATATRHYHIYFATSGNFSAPSFPARVTLTDGVQDEGFASYRIVTDNATYFYHKQGGGFSSLNDANGNDWISWNKAKGANGDFRGIPNLVNPDDGGYFHPGRTGMTSTVLSTGPLKATFKTASNNGRWEAIWELFPDHARMTVLKADTKYWFLYEGTPGGVLQGNQDFIVRSNGTQNPASGSWSGDLAGEEWVYMGDPAAGRSLYLVHHSEDNVVDSYKPDSSGKMTIMGFGRKNKSRNFTQVPKQFTIGLVDATAYNAVKDVVRNAYKPLNVALGAAEARDGSTGPGPTPTPSPTPLPTPPAQEPLVGKLHLSTPGNVKIGGVTYGDEDILTYDLQTGTWSLLFDGSAAGLPGKADIDGLAKVGDDLYLSFLVPVSVPGIGLVDDADIVLYSGGTFSLWLDGSAYGLTTNGENIDGIALDPQGRLVISTAAAFNVPGASGNLKGQDEDLLLLDGTSWSILFDGSHNAKLAKPDVWGVWLDDNGEIYLNTQAKFNVPGASGSGADIFICTPSSLGLKNTDCAYRFFWDGDAAGLKSVDGIDLELP